MEVLGRQHEPCKMEQELSWEGFHPSIAHQLLDGMPSQPGMSKEDQRISEPVLINTTMNKEEKWLDEALDRILEKFEQMEAKRRQEDKLNQNFQKLEEIEARRSKASEETIAAIRATTAILKAASSSTPMAPPPPAPTNCLMECHNNNFTWVAVNSSHIREVPAPMVAFELGDVEDKDPVPYIAAKDLPKVTPTKCSTICSSSDTKPDHIVATVVTCATLVVSSMELVAIDGTTGNTNIDTPDSTKAMPANCSTVGLDVKGGADHARVTCQIMMGVPEGIVLPDASSEVLSPWLIAEMDLAKLMPTECLMKCLKAIKKLLVGHPKRDPWPPPWSGGVVRGGEVWHIPWYVLDSFWTSVGLMPPWPPPTCDGVINGWDLQPMAGPEFKLNWSRVHHLPPWPPPTEVSCLALVCQGNVMILTELKDINLHRGELKPWPPPNQTNCRNTFVQAAQCKCWKTRVGMSLCARMEQWNLLNQESCTMVAVSSLQEHINGQEQILCKPWNPRDNRTSIDIILLNSWSLVHCYHLGHIVGLTCLEALAILVCHEMVKFGWAGTVYSDQDRHTIVRPARAFVRHELGIGNGSHILHVSEAGARCGSMRKLLELIRNERTFQIKIMVKNLLQEVNMISSFDTSILEMNTHVLKYSASTQVLDAHALNICKSIGLLNLMTHKQLQCLLIHRTWKFLLSVIVVVHGSRGSSFKAGLHLCAISKKYLTYNSMAIWDTKLLGMTRKD